MAKRPPQAQRVSIPGPAGGLEALIEVPDDTGSPAFAVLCHPHPLHGGTLDNKVVHMLARAFQDLQVPTIRFNFRGVGASDGAFDEAVGETDDALAVVDYGRQRWPGAALWLGGFSFGGVVAVRASHRAQPALLVTVAPAVTRIDLGEITLPDCPWLIVQGDADDVVEPRAVLEWAARLEPVPKVELLAGVGHFFHGHLHELRDAVVSFARSV